MSTQHPDNANPPSWLKNSEVIQGEDEIYEAYYAFSQLKCQEQMWDWEGKDVDPHVVRKLLLNHPDFFKDNILGRDIFLTYRIPNPAAEPVEKKTLVEALETIPRNFDVAKDFYKSEDFPPIFEVILPLTKSSKELIRVLNFYEKIIIGREDLRLDDEYLVKEYIGEFKPKKINVIPLIEDLNSILNTEEIISNFIKAVNPAYVRVFIARSDPALNYGLITAVLLSKYAISCLNKLSTKYNTPIYPIIGTGSPPFRGNLTPQNINYFLREYHGYYTVTIQSSIKFDHEKSKVTRLVSTLNKKLEVVNREIWQIDKELLINLLNKVSLEYRKRVEGLASLICYLSKFVPKRRARRLHIGLYGYSREVQGYTLPRAIEFTCTMYTIGIPPEFLGLKALAKLNEEEWNQLMSVYVNLTRDLRIAGKYLSINNIMLMLEDNKILNFIRKYKAENTLKEILDDIKTAESLFNLKLDSKNIDKKRYENITNTFIISVLKYPHEAKRYLVEAAKLRKFLG